VVIFSRKTLEELKIVLADSLAVQRKEAKKAYFAGLPEPRKTFTDQDVARFLAQAEADYYEVVDTDQSSGSHMVTIDGKKIIDFYSYFASGAIGHNHPVFGTVDWNKTGPHKPAHSDVLTRQYKECIAALAKVAPEGLTCISHINATGARAVESAIKACFHHRPWATKVLSAKGAFHGRTLATLSATHSKLEQKFGFPSFRWPTFKFPVFKENDEAGNMQRVEKSLKQIEKVLKKGRLACVIAEPIQGEGGDRHAPVAFWKGLRELTYKYNVPLVLDEVQTGFGMTGKMWAHEYFGIAPDIVVFSKKSHVSGYFCVPSLHVAESGRINSTTGGDLNDMVRTILIIETILKENLLENVKKMGAYLKGKLLGLQENFSTYVSNVRGEGLMLAFDLPTPEARDMLHSKLLENGLLALKSGTRSIRFRPYLDVKQETIDQAMQITEKTLAELSQDEEFRAAAALPYSDEHTIVADFTEDAHVVLLVAKAYANWILGLRLDRKAA
jgi:L-lysine 6-transaminase